MSHGPVMLDLAGTALTAQEREMLAHPAAGGVILFSRNYVSTEQITDLITDIHSLRSPSLLVAVDQEGGRVQRFKKGFIELPPAAWFGELYRSNPVRATSTAQSMGWVMATELRACGVDFSFAPVLDIGGDLSKVIGDRAFSENPQALIALAHAWMNGVHDGGMPAVGKHFPGHGGVEADSHHELPIDTRSLSSILKEDLIPFKRMIEHGMEAIMPAHVVYKQVSDELAGFSTYWLQEVLRDQLKFQGVIFSDDLTMAAAGEAGSYPARAQAALKAGCDMILVCNNPQGAEEVLDSLVEYSNPVAQMRLVRMHGRKSVPRHRMHLDVRWKNAMDKLAQYDENPTGRLDL